MANRPFLTLVTRCCDRPLLLKHCLDSVIQQNDTDIEVVFIIDNERRGVLWANQQFEVHSGRVIGDYVYLLDDDCKLPDRTFVRRLKAVRGNPGCIMVKCKRPQLAPRVLPKPGVWGKRDQIRITATNGGCFVVRRDVFLSHCHRYAVPAAGDAHFIIGVKNDNQVTMAWLDVFGMETMQLGRGKKFDVDSGKDWWLPIVQRYGIEDCGMGPDNLPDWRLRLWRR